jgi:nitroreductase
MFEESPSEAWVARYGVHAPDDLPSLKRFLNHRSVREYSSRPVDESVVRGLIAAAQSSATSSNLQLWSVVSVQDPERRAQIARLCADQVQVHEAPWFFAFLVDHHRLRSAARAVGEDCKGLDYNEFYTMAVIDAALAAERLVCAAEHLGLGICYIGALRNDVDAVKELLELPEGTMGVFGLCLGWPEEGATSTIKPRLGQGSVWFRERYGNTGVGDYDERMAGYFQGRGMKAAVTWTMRSGRRVDEHHLTGRERLKGFLELQGLDKR